MATYQTLKVGSSGSDVTKLQQALKDQGYNITVDGQFGNQTASVVKQYQQKNGLIVDGLAGDQTLGKLYASTTAPSTQTNTTTATPSNTASNTAQSAPAVTPNAYQQALAALNAAQKELPTYKGTYDQQLNDLYNKIINREKFTYDVNADALYQQYANQYTTLGKMAMEDTMGQAAALTGGYGNTYAQSVGQQQYNAYLNRLNDVIPELYNTAYGQYQSEGQDLMNQYSATGALVDDEYGRYQDALSQYWANVNNLQNQANTAYSRQQDAYENLVNLITSTGYTPTAQELSDAGMSQAQADSYKSYYDGQQAAAASSGGGSGGRSSGGSGYRSSGGGNPTAVPESGTKYSDAISAIDSYVSKMKGTYDQSRYTKSMTDPYTGRAMLWDSKQGKWIYKTDVEVSAAEIKSGLLTESQWNNNKSGFASYGAYLDWFIDKYLK